MQFAIQSPFKATVTLFDHVPRRVGNKVREYTVEVNQKRLDSGKEKIDFEDYKDLDKNKEKLKNVEPEILLVFERMGVLVTQYMIKEVKREDGEAVEDIEDFLQSITDEDFGTISEKAGNMYKEAMEEIQKKTTKKGTK